MADQVWVWNGTNWNTEIIAMHAWNDVNWNTDAVAIYAWNELIWYQVWPATTPPPVSCPTPGEYTLSPTSLYLPNSGTGYAEFDTSAFQFGGCIKTIHIQISWKTATGLDNDRIQVSGRPNGNYYREIANDDNEWDGRTINHRIDSFDATSLTDFNSGAATGFTLSNTGPVGGLGQVISNVKLVVTT